MKNEISIQKGTVLEEYRKASEEQKKVLENLFGKDIFLPKDITERIKTFEDACNALGRYNDLVSQYKSLTEYADMRLSKDVIAYLKLRIIVLALNEGWRPTFNKEERRYYPWFFVYANKEYDSLEKEESYMVCKSYRNSYMSGGIVYAHEDFNSLKTSSNISSVLALKTSKLAEYFGKQFIDIWADYLFC